MRSVGLALLAACIAVPLLGQEKPASPHYCKGASDNGPCILSPIAAFQDSHIGEGRQCGQYFVAFGPRKEGEEVWVAIKPWPLPKGAFCSTGHPTIEVVGLTDFTIIPDDSQEAPTVEYSQRKKLLRISSKDLQLASCLQQP